MGEKIVRYRAKFVQDNGIVGVIRRIIKHDIPWRYMFSCGECLSRQVNDVGLVLIDVERIKIFLYQRTGAA